MDSVKNNKEFSLKILKQTRNSKKNKCKRIMAKDPETRMQKLGSLT